MFKGTMHSKCDEGVKFIVYSSPSVLRPPSGLWKCLIFQVVIKCSTAHKTLFGIELSGLIIKVVLKLRVVI